MGLDENILLSLYAYVILGTHDVNSYCKCRCRGSSSFVWSLGYISCHEKFQARMCWWTWSRSNVNWWLRGGWWLWGIWWLWSLFIHKEFTWFVNSCSNFSAHVAAKTDTELPSYYSRFGLRWWEQWNICREHMIEFMLLLYVILTLECF